MRMMKRVAAVALSVVVLMTSGVSAKAAVTDVQPAKSSSEAVLKWANKIGTLADWGTYTYNNLSEIAVVGDYIYAADDGEHRIMKISKKTGEILKSVSYKNDSYTIHYGAGIGTGDRKIFVGYDNGIIQAFDADTLQSVWITKPVEKVEDKGQYDQSNAISGGFVYDNGYLYASTGTYSGKGSLVALTTKDEDTSKDYEVKEITWQKENDATYYWDKAKSIGNVIVICDASGKLKSYDKKTGEVKSEVKIDNKFSGGIAYDTSSKTIYLAADHAIYGENNKQTDSTANLYGVKIENDGTFGAVNKVEIGEHEHIASTPEVYNGKVYVSGTAFDYSKGFMAVVDVVSDQYKVNYKADLPGYSQSTPIVVKDGTDSVNVYFTVNANPNGGIYVLKDSKGATSGTAEKIFEPEKDDQKQFCANELHIDNDGTLYYINDSRYLFAVGKKVSNKTPSSSEATTVVNETKVKPVTKTVKSTRSVKLTWKKKKGAKGYVIYAKAGKGKYKKVTTVGKKTSKTIKVNKDSSYKFKVKPYKLTKKNKKKYFKAYAAKAKFGNKTVKVTFKNVTGYASYKVQMKAGKAAYKTVKTTIKGGTITYTKKKAKVGTTYKFRLKGINKVNGKTVSVTIK